MNKIHHVSMSIEFLMDNYTNAELAKKFNQDGQRHQGKTYRKWLQDKFDAGERLLPIENECEGWDPVTGCPGHEVIPEPMSSAMLDKILQPRLEHIKNSAQNIVTQIIELKREHPVWEVDCMFDYTQSEKAMSAIIELIADAYDRVYGKEGKKATRYKIRKALGYTYP